MRSHSGKDCSHLTTSCRSRSISPLALISEFAKRFLPWSGLGISQKQAIHLWNSCLVKWPVRGGWVALAQVFAPRPLRAESWMTRGDVSFLPVCLPKPCHHFRPNSLPGTSPAPTEISLLWHLSILGVHPCYSVWTMDGSISIAGELVRNGVSGFTPYRLNLNVWCMYWRSTALYLPF